MCTIMGVFQSGITTQEFLPFLERTKSRGPDDTEVISGKDFILGFQRLAIMGLTPEGMQPFELNGKYLVCNGEIYGFRKIRELLDGEYSFKSDSDCEVLLPLYEKYGTNMFTLLDAEYALIIADTENNRVIAARDPVGIRPLFYGYLDDGGIAYASEAKNLIELCKKVIPFPPGHYCVNGVFHQYRDISRPSGWHFGNTDDICNNIREKLISGIEKRLDSDVPLGFLLSGGLDSSIVCAVAAKLLKKPISTFSVGMNTDAIDLKYAKIVADHIGSRHTEVIITKEDVLNSLETVIYTLATYDITTIRASIGMYLICKWIHENTDIRVILTGEVSDELFGYKYTDFAPDPVAFQKEAEKRLKELYMYDVLRADRCISVNSLEARVPFGDLDFADYVMGIDPAVKMNTYGTGKYLLRKAFEGDWLPDVILWREKAAFSDAVGHSMVDYLKAYAESLYTDKEFTEKCKSYTHAPPFTKESLLYREIFEKYYPGQGEMVADFWMPNKSWAGCDVNDPSARVLSNYGNSGK
ncbi:MAG: asparagine synthase B [Clostridiales bacterium]|nr:asparagine synthase B [Clostridiales bacterium]